MTKLDAEQLKNVSFVYEFQSRFMKPLQLNFEQNEKTRTFDISLSHGSVATLLYHTEFHKFLVVRQFRPAVFVGAVQKFPENKGKSLENIDWNKYDTSLGYTIELCAGLIDKELPVKDIAREEIEEECGYTMKTEDIHHLATYIVDADETGATQYLFYAEIDESMKISEGGGNVSEGEVIGKVFLAESEALSYLSSEYSKGPPGALYALLWWFQMRNNGLKYDENSPWTWKPSDISEIKNLRFSENQKTNRFHPTRMHYTLGPITRSWDMSLCEDSLAMFVLNTDTREIIFTQRFRPGIQKLADVDWSTQPPELAYTLELCSGHYSHVNEAETRAHTIAVEKLGYRLNSLSFVTSAIIGISQSGDRQRLYFATVDNTSKVNNWQPLDDVKPDIWRDVGESRADILSYYRSDHPQNSG